MDLASRRRVHRESPARKKGSGGTPEKTGSNPTDRGKAGSKRTLLTDGKGIPLAVVLSGANRHDSQMLGDVLDAVVIPVPEDDQEKNLCLDRGYDTPKCRELVAERQLTGHIPKKASEAEPLPAPGSPERHPPRRWVVEVGHSWFNRFRRLLIRWEKKAVHHLGFVQLAAALIIWRKLAPLSE